MIEVTAAEVKMGDTICGADGKIWDERIHHRVLSKPRVSTSTGLLSGKQSECRVWLTDGECYAVENVDRRFYVRRDRKVNAPMRSMIVDLDGGSFIVSVYDLNDDECVGWKLSTYPKREVVFSGLFDVYPDIEPDSDQGMSDLVDMICEAHVDWKYAKDFWYAIQSRLGAV